VVDHAAVTVPAAHCDDCLLQHLCEICPGLGGQHREKSAAQLLDEPGVPWMQPDFVPAVPTPSSTTRVSSVVATKASLGRSDRAGSVARVMYMSGVLVAVGGSQQLNVARLAG